MEGFTPGPSVGEAAAALTDVGRLLGLTDEAQRAHLAGLGLKETEVDQAMLGTAGFHGQVPDQNVGGNE